MRWILRIVAGLLVVLVAAIVGISFYLDQVIGAAIERGGSYALGVPTHVGSVNLGLLSGNLRLSGLTIANPPGFEAKDFVRLGQGSLSLDLASLRRPTTEIRELRLSDVEIALEKNAQGTNYGVITKRMASEDKGAPPAEKKGQAGSALILHQLVIEDVLAHYDVPGGVASVEISIPEVRLSEIGGKGEPVTTAQLSEIIVHALLASVARYGVNLPTDLVRGLSTGLSGLGSLGYGMTGKVGTTVSETGASLGRAAEGGVKGAADAVGAGAGKAVDAIGGLLGTKKDE